MPDRLHTDVDQLNRTAEAIGTFLNYPYSVYLSGRRDGEMLAGSSYQRGACRDQPRNNPFILSAQLRIRDLLLAGLAASDLRSCHLAIQTEDGRQFECFISDVSEAIEERFLSGPNTAVNSLESIVDSLPDDESCEILASLEDTLKQGVPKILMPHLRIWLALHREYPRSLLDIEINIPRDSHPKSPLVVFHLPLSKEFGRTGEPIPSEQVLRRSLILAAVSEDIDSVSAKISDGFASYVIDIPRLDSALDALACSESTPIVHTSDVLDAWVPRETTV